MSSDRKFESDIMLEWVDKIKNSNIIRTAKLKPTLQLDQVFDFRTKHTVQPKFFKVSYGKYILNEKTYLFILELDV